ncbi:unnamed protein product [Clavelina lepadiformis]|uniref:Uncharacterized protein n=1 Tax=Clavelina lepadiformis TaxID=159417 RepID=A0ABP0FZE4_CLALP
MLTSAGRSGSKAGPKIAAGYGVLDLDEKSQILKSVISAGLRWSDQLLTWKPENFDNLTEIIIPVSKVWKPDILCEEDIANEPYSPRIPYVTVTHEGEISHHEPVQYETTCSVNIAYFPFDKQVCTISMVSWSLSSAKLDLVSRRNAEEMMTYTKDYFLASGEWILDQIIVKKRSVDYSQLEQDVIKNYIEEYEHHSNEPINISTSHIRQLFINPKLKIKDIAPDRVTNHHWTDIKYTYTFRRNSSLHLQSMLFPAILLTTISLLGFYLPPDSGERIGLQITILLTFMVFLLTVSNMFPASTGPFLGIYYVICMVLLGLNIAMTILVLYLYFIVAPFSICHEEGRDSICLREIPNWIKIFLVLIGEYKSLKNFSLSDTTEKKHGAKNINSARFSLLQKLKKPFQARGKGDINGRNAVVNFDKSATDPVIIKTIILSEKNNEKLKNRLNGDENYHGICLRKLTNNASTCENNSTCTCNVTSKRKIKRTSPHKRNLENSKEHRKEQDKVDDDNTASLSFKKELKRLIVCIESISDYLQNHQRHITTAAKDKAVEDKWKEIVRNVDHGCLRLYFFLLIASNLSILLTAFITANMSQQ